MSKEDLLEEIEILQGYKHMYQKLIEQNKRYRRTLEFYADRKSWELGDPYEPRDCDAWRDQGRKARQALESESDE